MASGINVRREFVVVLNDGTVMLEWDDGTGIDLLKGVFIRCDPQEFCQPVSDYELEILKRAGRIQSFDRHSVVISSLPEVPEEKSS